MTILNSAHFSDKKKVLKTLVKTGANINAKNDQGQTALHIAVNRGENAMKCMDCAVYYTFFQFLSISNFF